MRDRPAPALEHPARALARAAADLQHVPAAHVPERTHVVLADPLGAPEEARVTEELAVRGLVLVGVGVPVGTVGQQRLGLVDGTSLGADSRHGAKASPWTVRTARLDAHAQGRIDWAVRQKSA